MKTVKIFDTREPIFCFQGDPLQLKCTITNFAIFLLGRRLWRWRQRWRAVTRCGRWLVMRFAQGLWTSGLLKVWRLFLRRHLISRWGFSQIYSCKLRFWNRERLCRLKASITARRSLSMGYRQRSMYSSAPTILPLQVLVPSTPSRLLSFKVFVLYLCYICHVKRTKRGRVWAIFKRSISKNLPCFDSLAITLDSLTGEQLNLPS